MDLARHSRSHGREAPSTKLQAPKKHQNLNTKQPVERIAAKKRKELKKEKAFMFLRFLRSFAAFIIVVNDRKDARNAVWKK
jgi:hypothetical protein